MYAVIGEDKSDAATLKVIIRRLLGDDSIAIRGKGCGGCGDLLNKGARLIRMFADQGAERFVVVLDADGDDPTGAHRKAQTRIIGPAGVRDSCIVVPVQELEAWILADEKAIRKVIASFKLRAVATPEEIRDPKEHLTRLSRRGRTRPLYVPNLHNEKIAQHLDLRKLLRKCPSFQPLHAFVCARPAVERSRSKR